MLRYNSGIAKVNNHFVIKNLPQNQSHNEDSPMLSIIQNLITRGNPTIASPFLREKLNLDRSYLDEMDEIRIIQSFSTNWNSSIRGDSENNFYPALTFYKDLRKMYGKKNFLADLFIAECPITDIVSNNKFEEQEVDFYSPLLKLVIEVDGHSHKDIQQKKLDQSRDKFLKRNNVDVIRISTLQIKNKDYKVFTRQLADNYYKHESEIKLYEKYLDNPSYYQLHYELTEIYRFQMLIIELIKGNHLHVSDKKWDFAVNDEYQAESLKIALEDLNKWLEVLGRLFNDFYSIPEIYIHSVMKKEYICIDNLVGKYWDDSLDDPSIIYMRDDYFEKENYRIISTSFIVNYFLSEERHLPSFEYILDALFGFKEFRKGQMNIIINTLNLKDTVGLLPTGGGKSLTYQICTFLQPSISLVVAPIKALMVDQIKSLEKKHYIDIASYINSDLPAQVSSNMLEDFTHGKYLFLVISPERFQQQKFRDSLQIIQAKKQFAYAVIDEAHCLSEWGHDFRTSYLALAKTIRKYAPTATFLALTATASSKVLQDIRNELNISSQNVKTISSFKREELNFHVVDSTDGEKTNNLIQLVNENKIEKPSSPIIVFSQTVGGSKGCYKLSNRLDKAGFKSGFYSGSKPKDFNTPDFTKYKENIQHSFMNNKIDVLVATKAFGMGIDKPDVNTVIHYGIPSSLESYYQEAGRAGRDRTESDCYIIFTEDTLSDRQKDVLFGLNTNVDEIKEARSNLSGDLNSILFLMEQGLKNVEEEVSDVASFYLKNFVNKENQKVHIQNQGNNEKIIYRLSLLGLVEDWTIDWKSKMIIVDVTEYNEEQIKNNIFIHIQKYESTFTETALYNNEEFIDYAKVMESDNYTPLYKYTYILIKWYNDNIIYSRKQSLKNIYNYTLEFKDSNEFQHKLETYFKRNDDVYFLEKTVVTPANLDNWWKIYYVETNERMTPKNESEIKDLSITVSRFLESYKNDPALNLIEGIGGLISKGHLNKESKQRLIQSIKHISNLEKEIRKEMLISILDVAYEFFKKEEKGILSQTLIDNGFNSIDDKKIIHKSLDDEYSYTYLIKHLTSKINEVRIGGGYPWDN